MVEVTCRYSESARYDEVIEIRTELAELGRASLAFNYRISRAADHRILATGATRHASIDSSGRLVRIPEILLDAIRTAAG